MPNGRVIFRDRRVTNYVSTSYPTPTPTTTDTISVSNFTGSRMASLNLVAMNTDMLHESNCPMSSFEPGTAFPSRYTWFRDNDRLQVVEADGHTGASGAELETRLRELFHTLLKRIGLQDTTLKWQLVVSCTQFNSRVKMIHTFVDKWYLPTPKGKETNVFLFFSPICENDLEITASLDNFNFNLPVPSKISYVTATTLKM